MLFYIMWLLCGVVAASIQMFSFRKDWWDTFEEDFFKSTHSILQFLISIIIVFGGPFSVAAILIMNKIIKIKTVLYFRIPKT